MASEFVEWAWNIATRYPVTHDEAIRAAGKHGRETVEWAAPATACGVSLYMACHMLASLAAREHTDLSAVLGEAEGLSDPTAILDRFGCRIGPVVAAVVEAHRS